MAVFTQTFASFNSTLKTLNESYAALQSRYQRIADELGETNEKLRLALAEQARTRSFLEHVLESLTAGVVTIDLQGRVTSMNPAGCRILGVTPEEVVGQEYDRLFAGGFAASQPLTGLLNSAPGFQNHEKRIELDVHTYVPISTSGAPIRDTEGKLIGALEVFADLTELRLMEEEVARVKSLAALGEVAAVIAHEVRNPLSGIGGFAALLQRELGEDHPHIDYVRKISGGVLKLEQTVSSLLEYARDLKLEPTTGDLRELVKETVDAFRIGLSAREVLCAVNLRLPEEKLGCRFDREHLARALNNLLLNAHQASPADGEISVEVDSDADAAKIMVSDRGEPIPEQMREKIFTPFFTTREGGTGLGLALVKKIVDAHHGSIELSTPDLQSKSFVISLPKH
ncbi:MAG: ATP-binding protein [bacterium]